jgi:hypothetical protein
MRWEVDYDWKSDKDLEEDDHGFFEGTTPLSAWSDWEYTREDITQDSRYVDKNSQRVLTNRCLERFRCSVLLDKLYIQ